MRRKVLVKTKGVNLPEDSLFYLIAKKNKRLSSFLVKRNFAFEAIIEINQIPEIEEQEEELNWKLPPIPSAIITQFIEFFRLVKTRHNSEALALLYFNPQIQKFRLEIPEQDNAPMTVSARESMSAPDGYYLIGTIHSHPDRAFHSEKDIEDEFNHTDGIHVVVGNLISIAPDYCCTVVINSRRFNIAPTKVLELPQIPSEWLEKLHPKTSCFPERGKKY